MNVTETHGTILTVTNLLKFNTVTVLQHIKLWTYRYCTLHQAINWCIQTGNKCGRFCFIIKTTENKIPQHFTSPVHFYLLPSILINDGQETFYRSSLNFITSSLRYKEQMHLTVSQPETPILLFNIKSDWIYERRHCNIYEANHQT